MPSAKDIIIKPISMVAARAIVKKIHYSGKVTNSQLHFGIFLNGKLEGALQFGPSIDKRKTAGLVKGSLWSEFIELNRMALSDALPKNSESRSLSICIKLIKKHYPQIKWIISFSDGTQCGDGTIYRASGFYLTSIKKNTQMLRMPNGDVVAKKSLDSHIVNGKFGAVAAREAGAKPLEGFQLRYVYFIDKSYKERLTVPILPFSEIDKRGASMYKGVKRVKQAIDGNHPPSGGAAPTDTLQPKIEPYTGLSNVET
tara:strand:- start:343 stop:1110 length:768 start_codon:yes stop_codon:yes gene_type:complete